MQLNQFLHALAAVDVRWVGSFADGTVFPDDAVLVGRRQPDAALAPSILTLDNKAQEPAVRKPTLTDLVCQADDGFFADWPPWAHRPMQPQQVLDAVTLIVEDASPDSVFAMLLLLARMVGCNTQTLQRKWLPAIRRWKSEGMVDAPASEWPSLVSALVHAEFPAGPDGEAAGFGVAWNKALHFTAQCLLRQVGPAAVEGDGWPLLEEARAALEREQQVYLDALPHASIVQLSLPTAGLERRRIVDALIMVEDQPAGATKLFYRNDRTRSPLGHGFTLGAVFRPSAAPGDRIVIALDTRRGVTLRELWVELERREIKAWKAAGIERPDWNPRGEAFGPYNQPWYVGENDSVIGDPCLVKLTRDDAVEVAGSRLSWSDVLDTMWAMFDPLQGVDVIDETTGKVVPLTALQPEPGGSVREKHLLAARWPPRPIEAGAARPPKHGAPLARSLGTAPVVERIMAALVSRGGAGGTIHLQDLPTTGAWERLELSGGFAIIAAAGLLIFDDWRESVRLDMDALRRLAVQGRRFDRDLVRLEKDHIAPLAAEIGRLMDNAQIRKEQTSLVSRAAQVGVQLAALRSRNALVPSNVDERKLQAGMTKAWALDSRLAAMEKQIEAMSGSLKTLGDAQVRRVSQFVAFIGFPFYVSAGVATPLAKLVVEGFRELGWGTNWLPAPDKDPPAYLWWLCFLTLLLCSLLIARQFRDDHATTAQRQLDGTRLSP